MNYWLMKSEPDEFSIDHLKARPRKTGPWDGVRNYQARNMLRDEMKKGDQVFFYHASCAEPGIVGIMEVVREGYIDQSAFDPTQKYYDPKSDPSRPRWYQVDVRYKRKLKRTISLTEIKADKKLRDMRLVQPGNRLSVMPVSKTEWQHLLKLENKPA